MTDREVDPVGDTFAVFLKKPRRPEKANRAEVLQSVEELSRTAILDFLEELKRSGLETDLEHVSDPMVLPMFYFVGNEKLAEIARKMSVVEFVSREKAKPKE